VTSFSLQKIGAAHAAMHVFLITTLYLLHFTWQCGNGITAVLYFIPDMYRAFLITSVNKKLS